jgi:hypothetical protein
VSFKPFLFSPHLLFCKPCLPFYFIESLFSWKSHLAASLLDPLIPLFPIGMEDAHAVSLNLDEPEEDANSNTFFAVYDGHGGTPVISYLPSIVVE